ncbi:hypothetical protein AGJ34_20295 [Cronobacter dublinensis subsp. dublinensis]|nr:hypothetical protein [Cronobacter dublinensis subsp. dublinensis]EGT5729872.1 hypothetical protein [Cronobacter dublinensis subsp. dublinensis]
MSTNNLRFASLVFMFIIALIVIFHDYFGVKISEELAFRFLIFISLPFSLVKSRKKKKSKCKDVS